MTLFIGLCVFLAVLLACYILYNTVRKKLRNIGITESMAKEVVDAIKSGEIAEETTPRSLSGMDSILIPRIKADFPDFNVDSAKQYAREYLKQIVGEGESFKVHNVVIHKYNRYNNEKVIVMQASFQLKEDDRLKQKRITMNYSYLLTGNSESSKADGANCPNCGAPFSKTGSQVCEYCGSYVAQILKNTWKFTDYKID